MKKTLLTLLSLMLGVTMFATPKQTFVYNVIGGDTLRLDLYSAPAASAPTPAMIFAFGGGFSGGERDEPRYVPMFDFLAYNGVNVISIDYRTKLKGVDVNSINSPKEMLSLGEDVITSAVTDMLTATGFVLAHCREWNIAPGQLFACGSSAGAITALQAEYTLCNTGAPQGFPEGFHYAGVISMAGAIFSPTKLVWGHKPCPMLLFHGNADMNVPYSAATVGQLGYGGEALANLGLYGSEPISQSLAQAGVPFWFDSFMGADHTIAVYPMQHNRGEILDFICAVTQDCVQPRTTLQVFDGTRQATTPTILDLIRSNYIE